jgi:hypothetical protein
VGVFFAGGLYNHINTPPTGGTSPIEKSAYNLYNRA